MNYYFSKQVNISYEKARTLVEGQLAKLGFGIVSEIDMHEKFKAKLGVDFRKYKILGACSPKDAYEAVTAEEHIGLMLPCNVVIQEKGNDQVEVSVIDPVASMMAVENKQIIPKAEEIREKLKTFLDNLTVSAR